MKTNPTESFNSSLMNMKKKITYDMVHDQILMLSLGNQLITDKSVATQWIICRGRWGGPGVDILLSTSDQPTKCRYLCEGGFTWRWKSTGPYIENICALKCTRDILLSTTLLLSSQRRRGDNPRTLRIKIK